IASNAIFISSTGLASSFFDGDDFLAFVGPARQTGVVREFRLVALGANGEALGTDLDLCRSPLVAPRLRMLVFGVRHETLPSCAPDDQDATSPSGIHATPPTGDLEAGRTHRCRHRGPVRTGDTIPGSPL